MHGADIDARDLLKMTPLHWAVERGHRDVVECLLANGADVNIMSKFDKTPIDIARDSGRLDLIPILEVNIVFLFVYFISYILTFVFIYIFLLEICKCSKA